MCELLVLTKDLAPHAPALDHMSRATISTPGEIITMQEDGYPWHPEVFEPGYHAIVVKVPGVTVEEVIHWQASETHELPGLGERQKYPRQRMYHLPLERLQPEMTREQIEALLTRPKAIFR